LRHTQYILRPHSTAATYFHESTDNELEFLFPATNFEMYWASLAAELRGMILEALIHEGNVAHCATVCREWQAALEKHNFHSLSLRVQDIPAFKILGKRQLSLVRYV